MRNAMWGVEFWKNAAAASAVRELGAKCPEFDDRPEAKTCREMSMALALLLEGDYIDQALPFHVWKGLEGLECQQLFFEAWATEIKSDRCLGCGESLFPDGQACLVCGVGNNTA